MRYRKNTATHKLCPACAQVKERSCFSSNRSRSDGLQGLCKACSNTAKLRSIHRRPDHYRTMDHRHKQARKAKHPEAIRAEHRREYESHRDRYAVSRQRWFDQHPGERERLHRLDRLRRRAREAAAFKEDVEPIVVWARNDGRCHICGDTVSFFKMHLDHVVPLSRGGEHSYANVLPSHADCNQWKHARFLHELPAVSETTPQEEDHVGH